MPLFSIIMPTYNRAHLVSTAIESVINQSIRDWELIIIDDGSTDETHEMIIPFLEKHKNISYFWQDNQGKGGVRNVGISKAQGAHVTFLDDDDYLLPNHLETFRNTLTNTPKDTIIKSEGYLETKGKLSPLTEYPHDNRNNVIKNIWEIGAHLSSFCFPRYILDHFQFDHDLYFAQDYHLILRILLNHDNLVFSRKRTFVIVNHFNRATYRIDKARFEQLEYSRNKIYHYFIEEEKEQLLKYISHPAIKNKRAHDYLYLANYAARVKAHKKMILFLLKAFPLIKVWPKSIKKVLAVFYQFIINLTKPL